MNIDLDDSSLFGNDAAEDEDEDVLASYFVDQPAFDKFMSEGRSLWVVNGRKGTGKSALLMSLAHKLRAARGEQRPVVLATVPTNLVALREPPQTVDNLLLENYWKQVICGAINMELARDIGLAWSDNQMALVESAELAGFKGRDLISALLTRLVGKVSLGAVELANTPRPAPNHQQLLKRLDREHGHRRPVWFLLDDLDSTYSNSPAQRAFIAAFFSAARNLVGEMQGVRIRATLRNDVWTGLAGFAEMGKVEQYRTEIVWSASQQKAILANRILGYARRREPDGEIARTWNIKDHADELIQLVFAPRMKWRNSLVPPDHVLRLLGGGRPRWISQLCRMAAANARREGKERIAAHHITQAMGAFGTPRLADLEGEHGFQFADMRRLVEAFSGGPRRYTTDELLQRIRDHYLRGREEKGIPVVDGKPYEGPLQLAKFLYKCGFINGNNAAKARLEVPEFVTYDMRRDLLEVDTNLDDGMPWDVHPAYRNVLQIS